MYKIYLLVFIFFLNIQNCLGVIRSGRIVQVGPKKKVIFLEDDHPFDEPSNQQYQDFLQSLREADQKGFRYHILVEQPESGVVLEEDFASVLSHISQGYHREHFKNITIENIEVRCAANLAVFLLSKDRALFRKKHLFLSGNKILQVGKTTFYDVAEEFYDLYTKLQPFIETLSNQELKLECQKKLKSALEYFGYFLDKFEKYSINFRNYIWRFSPHLNEKDDIFSQSLMRPLVYAFTPLFDLNLIKTILNSKYDNLIVIAGEFHTNFVSQDLLLDKENNELLYQVFGNDDYVLDKKDFEKLLFHKYEKSYVYKLLKFVGYENYYM